MLIVHNIVIVIISVAFFDHIISDCINGTSDGCSLGTICFLNICYPSGGSCSLGQCADGFICVNSTCLNISAPSTSATTFETTITTTLPAATTTTTTPECVDHSTPGRDSDCPRAKYLCNDPLYYELMTEQCPLTCNRCPGTDFTRLPACFDRTAADGTSNCASVAYLCQNSLYRRIMMEQCPRTCNYC